MEWVNDLLGQAKNLSNEFLFVIALNLVGFALKRIPSVRNDLIPSLLMGLGAIGNIFIGNPGEVDPSMKYPEIRLALLGLVFGFIAWIAHDKLLRHLEKFVPGLPPTPPVALWFLLLSIGLLNAGCVMVGYERRPVAGTDGESVTFWASALFADEKLTKLSIDKVTKTTSSGLTLGSAESEVNAEAVNGFTESVVSGIVKGLK